MSSGGCESRLLAHLTRTGHARTTDAEAIKGFACQRRLTTRVPLGKGRCGSRGPPAAMRRCLLCPGIGRGAGSLGSGAGSRGRCPWGPDSSPAPVVEAVAGLGIRVLRWSGLDRRPPTCGSGRSVCCWVQQRARLTFEYDYEAVLDARARRDQFDTARATIAVDCSSPRPCIDWAALVVLGPWPGSLWQLRSAIGTGSPARLSAKWSGPHGQR